MSHPPLDPDEIARMKWWGIDENQLEVLEQRQRERIQALEDLLEAERQELEWIIEAREYSTDEEAPDFRRIVERKPEGLKLTWKDRIIREIADAGRPMLSREIASALYLRDPHSKPLEEVNNLLSVLLSRMVRDGALVRTKRKGQAGSLYSVPE